VDQSNNPNDVLRRTDPDSVLARRNAELEAELAALRKQNIVEGRFAGELPRYRLNAPCYLSDTYFHEGTELDYTEAPNFDMVPLNEPAKRMMEEELFRVNEGAKRQAAKAGREFFGLVTDNGHRIAQAMQDERYLASIETPRAEMPRLKSQIPTMPHTPEANVIAKRKPGRPARVANVSPPSELAPPNQVPDIAPITVRGPSRMG
jgi:hypothetical protein